MPTAGKLYLGSIEIGGGGIEWATITAMTGSPTRFAYTDVDGVAWYAFRWTASGSITVEAGYVDALMVGGGGGNSGGWGGMAGGGGGVTRGLVLLGAGSNSISVGGAGGYSAGGNSTAGGDTGLGLLRAPCGHGTGQVEGSMWGRAGSGSGSTNDITGTSTTYGNNGAAAGRAVVRVPQDFVTAVSGWV